MRPPSTQANQASNARTDRTRVDRREPGRDGSVQSDGQRNVNREASESGPSESELVLAAQRGAADAFAELVARYQDRVYNTCYRLCHDRAEALDLTQTTFMKALEALPRFEARGSVLHMAVSDRG